MADNPNRDTSRYIDDGWEQVFVSILQLLDDYEHYRYSLNISIRENVLARIESVIVAIQLAVRSLECAPFLQQLLRNVRGLFLDWIRCETVSQCTDVAVYALQSPPVIRTPTPGRTRLNIREDVLIQLRSFGFTWKNISDVTCFKVDY